MTRRIQNRPEEILHRPVARYLDTALPNDAWWTHPPNGGGRSKAEAGIFKALGTKPGVPDVLIVYGGTAYWIELKPAEKRNRKNGGLSDNQVKCHADLRAAGCQVATCYTVEEVEGTLRAWLPVRGRIAA